MDHEDGRQNRRKIDTPLKSNVGPVLFTFKTSASAIAPSSPISLPAPEESSGRRWQVVTALMPNESQNSRFVYDTSILRFGKPGKHKANKFEAGDLKQGA